MDSEKGKVINISERIEESKKSEKITLKDCIFEIDSFLENKITPEELNSWGKNLNVRMYLPILEKMDNILYLISSLNMKDNIDSTITIIELYKDLFFKVLLKGYCKIELVEGLETYQNYDKLYPFLNPYIMQYCKEDFMHFCYMLKDCLNFNNIFNFNQILSNFDYEKMSENTSEYKKLIEEIGKNEKLVSDLKDIMIFNDPSTQKFIEEVKKIQINNNKQDNKEE